MSLINQTSKYPMFKNDQGFKYPEAFEHWEQHDKMIWHYDEVPLGQDLIDFQNASDVEKKFIINLLRLFTQNDIMVGAGLILALYLCK